MELESLRLAHERAAAAAAAAALPALLLLDLFERLGARLAEVARAVPRDRGRGRADADRLVLRAHLVDVRAVDPALPEPPLALALEQARIDEAAAELVDALERVPLRHHPVRSAPRALTSTDASSKLSTATAMEAMPSGWRWSDVCRRSCRLWYSAACASVGLACDSRSVDSAPKSLRWLRTSRSRSRRSLRPGPSTSIP